MANPKLDELLKLAAPLIEYLNVNCNPHTSIIIETDRVSVKEDVISVPCNFKPRIVVPSNMVS